jgi:alpha-L-fucosidase
MKTLSILLICLLAIGCSERHVDPPAPVLPIPSAAQLAWHEMEMNAFVHFTTNTFTGKEWGNGDESPSMFNPTELNAEQWVKTFHDTGFKGVILTCKHHDGFCLWPSKFTEHSVKNSPYKNGQGDVVREVADACRRYGLKFGVYLSPWDRNHADYGNEKYIAYYRNQLNEIFTTYGPVFEMWFDGANGGTGYYGGANEKRTINGASYYDWPTTLSVVRQLEPDVIFFSDAGPGVRWVGNERGIAGETNWNTITPDTLYAGKPGIENLLNTGHPNGTHWIPAEVDVSIRPGWFYHAEQDSLVKSAEKLFDIYLTSVGRGSTLLLNVPPDTRGLIHDRDIASLQAWRNKLDDTFSKNIASNASVEASSFRGGNSAFSPANLVDGDNQTYWATDDGVTQASIEIQLTEASNIKYLVLKEYIALGQRVSKFNVEMMTDSGWKTLSTHTTIGYKRIIALKSITTKAIRVNILESKGCPVISEVMLY